MHDLTVVILDDSDFVLHAVRTALEGSGCRVVALSSPFALMKALARERPHVVLLDVHMPTLSGDRVFEISSRSGAFRDAAILFYSAANDAELQSLVRRYGADGFIRKTDAGQRLIEEVVKWGRVAAERRHRRAGLAPLRPDSPVVVVHAAADIHQRLQSTLLFRPEIERLDAADEAATLHAIREKRPHLLVVDGRTSEAPALIRRIRDDPEVRQVSIAALLDAQSTHLENALRAAGANVVLSEWQSTPTWDDAFQELLSIPPRRWTSFRLRIEAGGPGNLLCLSAWARNISVRGMLVETDRSLVKGDIVGVTFELSSPPTIRMDGRVVWEKRLAAGAMWYGLEFVGFHSEARARIGAFVKADSPEPATKTAAGGLT